MYLGKYYIINIGFISKTLNLNNNMNFLYKFYKYCLQCKQKNKMSIKLFTMSY